MKGKWKNLILPLGIVAIVVVYIVVAQFMQKDNYEEKYAGKDLSVDVSEIAKDKEGSSVKRLKYSEYLKINEYSESSNKAKGTYVADASNVKAMDKSSVESGSNYTDEDGSKPYDEVVFAGEDGSVSWDINVEEEGFYYIFMNYLPVESRGISIERSLAINGEVPFDKADSLTFGLTWGNKTAVTEDNQGNEIRPSQKEIFRWQKSFFKDYQGYEIEPFLFHFDKGVNTITLQAVNEPVAIGDITVTADYFIPTYSEYIADAKAKSSATAPAGYINKIQGEDSTVRSSASLYALFDRSSSATEPASVAKTKLNMIGGNNWRIAGQWIEWDVEVESDGFYNISVKARQNYERGLVSNRAVYLDGDIPFEEVGIVPFDFDNNWKILTLSDKDGNPYEFYLTKGVHTFRMEVTLGELGGLLQELQDSITRLNDIYLTILVLTGTEPDPYRDYHVDKTYPEVMDAMEIEYARLYELVDRFTAYTGQKNGNIATIQTVAIQLEKFCEKPSKIPKGLQSFKANVTALGTTILTLSEAAMDVDCLYVSAPGTKLPKVNENIFNKTWHEVKSFTASFFNDYNNLGNVYDGNDAITVWMFTGRDQSTILKSMIDDSFTPETGIPVNVKLVEQGTLLPSVVAGTGPDVAIGVQQGDPVNFALRNAAIDISHFPGYQETISNFAESAIIPFEFEGGYYGLPETQNYPVMFYRIDILEDLGLEVPETWQDLIGMLSTIQNNNLNVGVPSTERKMNNSSVPDMSLFYSMLYQNGGVMYNEKHSQTVMGSEEGVKGFELLTKLFNQYKLPLEYDAKQRFRTGEFPIIVNDYSLFNDLSVSAPEIKGLWDFTVIPGTVRIDENGEEYVDHSTTSWGTATMMLEGVKNRDNAWKFMQWWASTATQKRYGNELESVMGEAARYATANKEAFGELSWTSQQIEVLEAQRNWVIGTPEVAGGYYTNRHIVNAVRKVNNEKEDPRETLLDYTRTINQELEKKRAEFGLDDE